MKKSILAATALCVVVLLNSCKKDSAVPVALTPSSDISDTYTETGLTVQTPITHTIDANIGGYLEALPAHYLIHPKTRFPVIIFLNGSGSVGDGSQTALQVENNIAIPHLIQKGTFPQNFKVNGHNYQFIVLTPQFKNWPQPSDVNDFINYAVRTYRIDPSRLYVCGLSMGGGGAWDYAASQWGKRLAAVVPICGASGPTADKGKAIAQNNIPVWAFHNNGDPVVPYSYSVDYISYINSCKPAVKAKLTTFDNDVHDAWDKACNPNYIENGLNMYEWLLTYTKTN